MSFATGNFAVHDSEQFTAACQSAVDELTSWPLGDLNATPNRAHVLAHGLVAAFGLKECIEARGQAPHLQPRLQDTGQSRPVDPCDTYDLHFAHGMSSLDSSMLGEALQESAHAESCPRPPQPGAGKRGLGCGFDQISSCTELRENVWGQADCSLGWEDVGMGITEGQSIFVCGGRDHSWRGSTMGLQYCPARDCWSSAGAPLRDGVTFASVASLGETCFLFGNSLPPLSSIPNSEAAWEPLPTAPFTTGLQFAAVEAVGDRIVVAGGRSLPNKARPVTRMPTFS